MTRGRQRNVVVNRCDGRGVFGGGGSGGDYGVIRGRVTCCFGSCMGSRFRNRAPIICEIVERKEGENTKQNNNNKMKNKNN